MDIALSPRLGLVLLAALLVAGPVQAQIVTDGTVGHKVSLHGGQIEIGPDLGSRRGDNLFHSFEKFGIATGQTATFTGPNTIRNVISRVTGGEVSRIDGTLASRIGQADLYFLNPAGVLFGPNAKLDVPGSLHVSTAHELRFADGARFSALDKTASGLTVAAPETFGFLDQPAGRITVDQSRLQLTAGKTFSLVGGDIQSSAARIEASAGTINLFSLTPGGSIELIKQTQISAAGDGGGTIRIRSGTLIADNSIIDASNTTERAAIGGIDLHADAARLTNSSIVSDAFGAGRAGSVSVAVGTLEVRDGSAITSNTHASGDGGMISIQADNVIVSGGPLQTPTVIASDVIKEDASGAAAGVTINAGRLEIRDGGVVSSDTLGSGRAGTLTIGAGRLIVTSGQPPRIPTRISSRSQPRSTGAGGSIKIMAGAVKVSDGGAISASTLAAGNAGDVIVDAASVLISGVGGTGIFSQTFRDRNGSPSQAGDVRINAREIEVSTGGGIGTDTTTAGSAGTVTIQAHRLVVASGRPDTIARISSRSYWTGNGGTIEINAHTVEVRGAKTSTTRKNAHISTSAFNSGQAGNVIICADAVVVFGSGGEIASRAHQTGNGGAVDIVARSIRLSNGGTVNTESIDPDPDAGLSGPIRIFAKDTLQLDQGAIQTRTEAANGDDVNISSGRLIDLQDSSVTTSVASGKGSGGDIWITSPLMVFDNSKIIANALEGEGGNITIQPDQLIRSFDTKIEAASDRSVSGTITITAPNTDVAGSLIVLPETFLDASSQLREACAARSGRPGSAFTAGGRGSLPPDPGTLLASNSFEQPLGQGIATGSTERPRQAVKPVSVSEIPQPILGSPRLTCRG